MLRSGALKDPEVRAILDERFVVVWIDVRETPLPRRAWVKDVLLNARVDADNVVIDPFSQGFFCRSVVLAPDGETILNRNASTFGGTFLEVAQEGQHGYLVLDPNDYLSMLGRAGDRLEDLRLEERVARNRRAAGMIAH